MSEPQLIIDLPKCVGCRLCVKACPFSAIEMQEKKAVINDKCTFCGACIPACKFDAMTLIKPEAAVADDLSSWQGVWVFGEQIDGKIQGVARELIGKGRELADQLNHPLTVLVLGSGLDDECAELLNYPVDKVIYVDDPSLADYSAEPYSSVLASLIKERKPAIVLAGATSIGRSFLARVAVAVPTGLTADCTALDIDPETQLLRQTRPAFGGNIMATILCKNHRPQMATVRPKVMTAAEKISRAGILEKIKPNPQDLHSRAKRLAWLPEEIGMGNVADADIIVSGGRGLGKPEGFRLIEELAKALGGAVGSSRAAVDSGWIPYSHQVGQTGKTVQPKLYVACGISGAVQHQVGMASAKTIIAINKDKDEPMVGLANYALIGDLYEIIPALIKELKGE